MAIQNDHSRNMEWDRRYEECNVRESDELVVDNNDVVRRDNS